MKKMKLFPMGIVVMLVLAQSVFAADAVAAGKAKAQACAGCHNASMNNLAGKGGAVLVKQMGAIIAGELAHPPVLSGLSGQDIDDIAAFLNNPQ